jgi:hypothetical protein
MSNDLVEIKNALAQVVTGLDEDTLAVAGRGASGSGGKRISIKGGVFRKFAGGKEVGAIEDRHMNVVVVKMAHDPSRMYYETAYEEGAKISPTCWSSDSKKPDEAVKNAPAASCDTCPYSVKGSSRDGKSAACRLSWRTAVVLPNDMEGDVMQLVIPGGSVWGTEDSGRRPFRPYVQYLASNQVSAGHVVTKMQFDTKSSAPKLLFSAVAALSPEQIETAKRQGKSAAAEAAVKLNVFQQDNAEAGVNKVLAETEEASPEVAPAEEIAPKLREKKAPASQSADSAELINKWLKK